MSFFNRLEKLEDFWRDDGRQSQHDAQREILCEFANADPDNAATVTRCEALAGTSSVVRMIRHPGCGELRRALGDYCREKRYRFPGAAVIRCRHGNNVVMIGGDGKVMQIFASQPIPTPMENQQ
jgi:hypothetical protein